VWEDARCRRHYSSPNEENSPIRIGLSTLDRHQRQNPAGVRRLRIVRAPQTTTQSISKSAEVPRGTNRRVLRYGSGHSEERMMSILKWALIMLVVSIIAGLFGFTGLSAASADVARILFYIFAVIFLVLLLLGLTIFRA